MCGAYVELMREAREHIFLVGTLQPCDIWADIAPFHGAHDSQQGRQCVGWIARIGMSELA